MDDKQTNKQTNKEQIKPNQTKTTDTENRVVVMGGGEGKWVKGVNCMVTDGN